MKNFSLKSITAGLLLAFSFGAQAQNQMLVETTTSGTEGFLVSEIRSIKFGASTMIINLNSGNQAAYNIADISQYYFADATSTGAEASVIGRNLSINPNPASEQINFVYNNEREELINIELLDATGRSIASIYSGKHQGKQAYTQNLDVPAGLYFCRITADGKTSTKPFVVN
jgi:hypothetical protein